MWLFIIGSSIGSFLNVVAYRLPRGLNLSYPPSRCPSCMTPISFRDNIPVFGWLLLRGRCRSCGAPISIRYPVVELLAGIIVLIVGGSSWLSSDTHRPIHHLRDVPWLLVGRFVYHSAFLLGLLTLALLVEQAYRGMRRLTQSGLLLGLMAGGLAPALRTSAWFPWSEPHFLGGWFTGIAGLIVGGILGGLAERMWQTPGVFASLVLVAVYLGPSPACVVFSVLLAVWIIVRMTNCDLNRHPITPIGAILLASLLQIVLLGVVGYPIGVSSGP